MKKKLLDLLMAAATVGMAFLLMVYLHASGPLPGAENVIAADGVYLAEEQGYGGPVTVTVVITGGRVSGVLTDAPDETPSLGGEAARKLSETILAKGTTKGVDAVTGATVTSEAVLRAAADCIAQARAASGAE